MALRHDSALDTLRHRGVLECLQELSEGALVFDLEGGVLWANEAALEPLGAASRDDLIGMPLSGLGEDSEGDERLSTAEPLTQLGDLFALRGEQPPGALRITRSPLRDEGGRVVAVLGLILNSAEELRAREAVLRSRERLRALLLNSTEVIVVLSPTGRIVFVTPSVERVMGWEPSALVGSTVSSLVHPGDCPALAETLSALAASTVEKGEWRLRRADGTFGWFELSLRDLSGLPAISGVIVNIIDVTDKHRAQGTRRASDVVLRHVIAHMSDAFLGVDRNGVLTEWNGAAESLFGWSAGEAIGRRVSDLVVPEPDRAFFSAAFEKALSAGYSRFVDRPFEMRGETRDGSIFPVEVSAVDIQGGPRLHFAAFVRDISDRKAAEAKLARQALTDPLTNLPNRALLQDRLGRVLTRLRRRGGSVAVLFIDLDRFKLVNDALGHPAGDELLVTVAGRLRHAVRESDTLARYGGDEFVVVGEDAGSEEEAKALGDRLLEALSLPVEIAGRIFRPRASIGISLTESRDVSGEDLLREADIAMYRAKQLGGARIEMFEEQMESLAIGRFELERELSSAIEASLNRTADAPAGRLCVFYQPIVAFDGKMIGLEALVRWEHPERGVLAPLEFIPVAEESGLIGSLGRFVLEEAARQLAEWQRGASKDLMVSVNISARQVDEGDLATVVEGVLRRSGIEPSSLCLELTESALLRDSAAAAVTLERLSQLGVRLVIDDFGTGYSSLAYLQRFPIRAIKLDRSFVSGVPESLQDAAIVAAVINLAHALGMEAIAEGVETDEQREALESLGCELAQGFFWSPPRRPGELVSYIEDSVVAGEEVSVRS